MTWGRRREILSGMYLNINEFGSLSIWVFEGQFGTLSLFPNLQKVHGRAWFIFLLCFTSN